MTQPLSDVSTTAAPWRAEVVHEEIWLLGQPPLADYLDYVKRAVVDGAGKAPRDLIDAWRAANDYYHDLEVSENGIADEIEVLALPAVLEPLAAELAQTSRFQRAFDRMPTTFGMVELDKIVVSQRRVTARYIAELQARLEPRPDMVGLFRFCQPFERHDPPVQIRRLGSQRFLFTSESNDLRFQETALLSGDRLWDYDAFGPIGGVVGLVVGYGSNFLALIRSDDRMVLHNGYHRAVALRAAGYTHAPCIVQTVTRRDELEVAAAQAVIDDPAFYFRSRRPPILKDFFDPRIRTVLPVRRMEKTIEVSFEVKEHNVYQSMP